MSTFDPKFKNLNLIDAKKTEVIFNALHGKDGEDGVSKLLWVSEDTLYSFWNN